MLSHPVPLERFETIARRDPKIFEPPGRMKVEQLAARHTLDGPEARCGLITEKRLGVPPPQTHSQSENRGSHVVRLGVYVAATPEFTDYAKVSDAASELLRDIFGETTVSSRLIIGVASLALGSPVELEVILEVQP